MEEVVIILTCNKNGDVRIRVDKHTGAPGVCGHLAHIAFQAMNREAARLEKEGVVLASGGNKGRLPS